MAKVTYIKNGEKIILETKNESEAISVFATMIVRHEHNIVKRIDGSDLKKILEDMDEDGTTRN